MNKIRIAIFGLGVVGSHVVKLLEKNNNILNGSKFEIVALGAKNKSKKRNFNVKKYNWVSRFSDLENYAKPDVIIETIGGTGSYINNLYKYCIKKNISNNSANKYYYKENYDFVVKENNFFYYEDKYGGLKIPKPNLNGQFQLENASTAIATLRILEDIKEEQKRNSRSFLPLKEEQGLLTLQLYVHQIYLEQIVKAPIHTAF